MRNIGIDNSDNKFFMVVDSDLWQKDYRVLMD